MKDKGNKVSPQRTPQHPNGLQKNADVPIDKKDGAFNRAQTENNLLSARKKAPSLVIICDILRGGQGPLRDNVIVRIRKEDIVFPR